MQKRQLTKNSSEKRCDRITLLLQLTADVAAEEPFSPSKEIKIMQFDEDKIDEMTLALLYLVMHDESEFRARAWKGFDWDTMNRLHEKGFIANPIGKITKPSRFVVIPQQIVDDNNSFATPFD